MFVKNLTISLSSPCTATSIKKWSSVVRTSGFSAALKGVPAELNEAARIDGATELQSFFKITIPYIQITIISVTTTIVIFTLKVFDVVFGMTGGNFGTQVIANEQYTQSFRSFDFGRGAAVAMVLLIAVLPVVYYNIRDFSKNSKGF